MTKRPTDSAISSQNSNYEEVLASERLDLLGVKRPRQLSVPLEQRSQRLFVYDGDECDRRIKQLRLESGEPQATQEPHPFTQEQVLAAARCDLLEVNRGDFDSIFNGHRSIVDSDSGLNSRVTSRRSSEVTEDQFDDDDDLEKQIADMVHVHESQLLTDAANAKGHVSETKPLPGEAEADEEDLYDPEQLAQDAGESSQAWECVDKITYRAHRRHIKRKLFFYRKWQRHLKLEKLREEKARKLAEQKVTEELDRREREFEMRMRQLRDSRPKKPILRINALAAGSVQTSVSSSNPEPMAESGQRKKKLTPILDTDSQGQDKKKKTVSMADGDRFVQELEIPNREDIKEQELIEKAIMQSQVNYRV